VQLDNFGFSTVTGVVAGKSGPARVPERLLGGRRAGLGDGLAHRVHQVGSDRLRVSVILVGQHDHADLSVELDQGVQLVAGIRSSVSDVDLVSFAIHGEADGVTTRPVVLQHAHAVHLSKSAGAKDLVSAGAAGAELE